MVKPPTDVVNSSFRRLLGNPVFGYKAEINNTFLLKQLNISGDVCSSQDDQNTLIIDNSLSLNLSYRFPVSADVLISSSDGSVKYIGRSFVHSHTSSLYKSPACTDESIAKYEIKHIRRFQHVLRTLAIATFYTLSYIIVSAQTHDFNFKARELTHGQGQVIQGVKVDLNDGEYIGFTNSQGEVTIRDVPQGTYIITVSKPGYIKFVQTNYILDSDKNFNACLPPKIRVGPWGTDNFNVDWYKNTFRTVGTLGQSKDPPHWKQIAPINNRLAPGQYSKTDSLLVVDAINTIENGTGYDLIKLIPNSASADTTYTIEMNSFTNTSYIGYDINYITLTGNSKITTTNEQKRVIHEIVGQTDMKPYFTPQVPSSGSVMDPAIQTLTDPKPWDFDNIAITMDQHYAKKRGEQNLFLGNMQEFVAPDIPTLTTNTKPANGSIGLNKIVEIAWNKSAGTNRYHVDIANDDAFNNIIKELLVNRIDTLITLEEGKTYFMRVRAENEAGNSPWGTTTSFTTASPVLPAQASISAPLNGATKVGTPVQYTLSSNDATSFRVLVARDAIFSQMLKDTVVYVVNPTIPLPNGTTVFTKAYGINSNGNGLGSAIISFTTIKANPTDVNVTNPLNNATKVVQPFNYTSSTSLNAEQYEWIIRNFLTNQIVLDTIVNNPGFTYDKLNGGQTYTIEVIPINSDVRGNTSPKIIYTIIKDKPGPESVTSPLNNATKVTQPFTYTNTSGANSEKHEWQIRGLDNTVKLDTIISTLQFIYDKLLPGETVKARVRGVNTDQNGDWSSDVIYTIIKGTPNAINMTSPANNATEVSIPTKFTSTTGGPFTEGYKYEVRTSSHTPVTELTSSTNEATYSLPGNRIFEVRGWAVNTDVEGPKSEWTTFTTYNHAPGEWNITSPINNETITYVNKKLPITSTPSIDIDNDNVTKKYHITGPNLDTLIFATNNEIVYLDSARLSPDNQYTINAESTDGSKTTQAGIIIFKTPKPTTGIDDHIMNSEYMVFPNPVKNFLYIESVGEVYQKKTAVICSMDGTILLTVGTLENSKIDLSSLTPGMYLLFIYSTNQLDKSVFRVIKQ